MEEEKLRMDTFGNTKITFEAGANYVLEEIEEMLSLKNQYTSKCDFCDDLEWRIEQLKK